MRDDIKEPFEHFVTEEDWCIRIKPWLENLIASLVRESLYTKEHSLHLMVVIMALL